MNTSEYRVQEPIHRVLLFDRSLLPLYLLYPFKHLSKSGQYLRILFDKQTDGSCHDVYFIVA